MKNEKKLRIMSRYNDSEMLLTPGGRVSKTRIDAGKTQADFADSIGIGDKHLGYIERGTRRLTRDIAHRIADNYGERESWLLCETEYRTAEEERAAKSQLEEEHFRQSMKRLSQRDSLMIDLIRVHGYEIVEHPPEPHELKTDEEGNKYYDIKYEIISPSGAKRIISSEGFNKFLLSLNCTIEGQLLFITQRFAEGSFLYG